MGMFYFTLIAVAVFAVACGGAYGLLCLIDNQEAKHHVKERNGKIIPLYDKAG